jgi:predicted ATP-binding protein involved in virulence
MNKSAQNSQYCDNVEEELSRVGINETGPEIEEVLQHFENLNNKLEEKMYKEKADSIFRCIPIKMEMFYDRFDNECMEFPIFKYYDAYRMFQRITCASNEDIVRIKEMLIDRARKNTENLKSEYEFMKQLKKVLEDYCRGKEINIKNVMLREFSKDLGTVIDLYKKE